jgi:uncharacterized membrane protein/predicted DsbA family dithiol-disulfide isomerase
MSQSAKVNLASFVLGLAGFGASIYALVEHINLKQGAADLSCDISNLVNCTKVIGSSYGTIMGIPLGGFGMAFFGLVIATAVLPKLATVSEKWISQWRLAAGTVGLIVSLLLAYISYFQLASVCVVCSTVHVLSVLNFVAVLLAFLKAKNQASEAEGSAFLKLVSASLAFVVPSLVIGLVAPSIPWGGTPQADAGSTEAKPALASTAFPAELTSFSKSDFVGKGQDYRKGNDDAKVVLTMYSDLECPHCKNTSEAILKALSVVGEDKVLFVYRNYPLSNKCNSFIGGEGHTYACDLALASRCAGQQGKFWEMKDWAFSGIEMSPSEKQEAFRPEGIKAHAQKLGLDAARFAECLDGRVELPKIKEDIEIGNKLGLQGTPLLILNGRKYQGRLSPDALVSAFQAEVAAGTLP